MLQECIASVAAGGDVDRVIVVDNGTHAEVPPGVECVRPSRNLGFGGGANAGFRRAAELGATAIALINDDVVVEPGWLRPLIAALEQEESLRVRNRIAAGIAEKKWRVPAEFAEKCKASLPEGFSFDGEHVK